jgi:hypothetical protein
MNATNCEVEASRACIAMLLKSAARNMSGTRVTAIAEEPRQNPSTSASSPKLTTASRYKARLPTMNAVNLAQNGQTESVSACYHASSGSAVAERIVSE